MVIERPPKLALEDFVLSDYRSFQEQEIEADVPVPADLLPKSQRAQVLQFLRKSQKNWSSPLAGV